MKYNAVKTIVFFLFGLLVLPFVLIFFLCLHTSLFGFSWSDYDPSSFVWDTADTTWYTNNTSATEFIITTPEQLAGLAKLVNDEKDFEGKTIKLGSNIMLNDTSKSKRLKKWLPIGSGRGKKAFTGTFDGNGFVVGGVYINGGLEYSGLFGLVSKPAVIKNLGVIASHIDGLENVGELAGYSSGKIINCYSIAFVKGFAEVGGLVGNNKGEIISSYSISKAEGSVHVGGLVGNADDSKKNNGYPHL